jgi:phosphate-selective porin OprO/OprP
MTHRSIPPTLLAAALFAAMPAFAAEPAAVDAATLKALVERLERIEARLGDGAPAPAADGDALATLTQRLAILERKLELADEAEAAKAPTTPVVTVNDKGLSAKTPDGAYELKIRGLVQADNRQFVDDDGAFNDTWLFRRIRPTFEGSLGPLVGYRLTPEFTGDSATIVDAYIDVKFDPAYTLRVGKLKGPVGLERLQSGSALAMIERSFPTELAPNRDIGAQLQGELNEGAFSYAIGVFNGTADGRDATTSDGDDNAEFAGRIFFEPWKNDANALSGLGFGLGASRGNKEGSGNNFLPRYRTPGQNTFFSYRSAVAADGRHTRLSPHAYYYRNRFGLQGEWIRSAQELLVGASRETLGNEAWQLTASWVLTGEDASYRGVARPSRPYAIDGEGWGAFELVGRYGELDVDDDAFPLFADAASAATQARSWALGLNWYLNSNLKVVFNHVHTDFEGGAAAGADRNDEEIFFSRVQVAF